MKTKKTLKSGLHAIIWQENKLFVSSCLEIEVASQGKTKKEALENLEEALELYFEDEKLPLPKSYTNVELHTFTPKLGYA